MGKLRDKHADYKNEVFNPIIDLHNDVDEDYYNNIKNIKNNYADYYTDKRNGIMDICDAVIDDIKKNSTLMHQIALVYDNDIPHSNDIQGDDCSKACKNLKEKSYLYDEKNGFNQKHLEKEFKKLRKLNKSACEVLKGEYIFINKMDVNIIKELARNKINNDTIASYDEYINNEFKNPFNILYDMKATIGCINSHNDKIDECIKSEKKLPQKLQYLHCILEMGGQKDEIMKDIIKSEEKLRSSIKCKEIYKNLKAKELKHASELKDKAHKTLKQANLSFRPLPVPNNSNMNIGQQNSSSQYSRPQSLNARRNYSLAPQQQTNSMQQVNSRAVNQLG